MDRRREGQHAGEGLARVIPGHVLHLQRRLLGILSDDGLITYRRLKRSRLRSVPGDRKLKVFNSNSEIFFRVTSVKMLFYLHGGR